MPHFALVISPVQGSVEVDVRCEIIGQPDRWRGKTRRFQTTDEALRTLQQARVVSKPGPLQVPDTVPVNADQAIDLQLLDRTNSAGQERIYIQVSDTRSGVSGSIHDGWHHEEVKEGDSVEVQTPLGNRNVRMDKILANKITKFGTDETRREMAAEGQVF